MVSREQADGVGAVGERVIDALPALLPTGREEWRPDSAWKVPDLPAGWNRV